MNSVFHVGFIELVNQYIPASVPTLYPLKPAENLKFSEGYQIGHIGKKWVKHNFMEENLLLHERYKQQLATIKLV